LDEKTNDLRQETKSKDKSDDNTQMSGMDKVAIGAGATGAAAGLGAAALAARKGRFQPALNIIRNLVPAKATRYAKQGEEAAKAADRGVRNPILEDARARNIAEGTKSRNATRLDTKNRKLKEDKAKEDAYDARRASDMEARFKKGGTTKMARGGMPKDTMAAMMARRRPRMGAGMPPPAPPVMPPQPPAPMGMKKGGMTRTFGKGGMHKMPDGKMMKNSAMNMGGMAGYNKGGMPMKDGKPAFMQKKMNMGGMAKYAKGGGIESRGKTKGTVIRMASGGSVSARADGIAQRGKTKFRVY
jgi:hypothetical protein